MPIKRFTGIFTLILAIVMIVPFFQEIASVHAASDITVDLNATKQSIRGFGGMNHPAWIGDLTESQRTTAFGNGDGQLGLSVLRIFVDENSNNWSRELATAKRASALGATVFASPWNPPSSMTEVVNGQKRLKYNQYSAYANHLNSFVSYMKQNGVDLYAISVQNEPDYAQDWTGWTPQEMLNFMKSNAGSISTRVIAPESFQYRKVMSDPILNDTQALANMDILGAHLYGTQLRDFPYPLFKQKGQGKELWMTEVYTESSNDADVWPLALDVAYNIHNSMVEAEFNAYVWWYIRRSYGLIKENGQISKRGYAMAQFSKFVRPGYVRVDATKNPTSDVYVSAYKNGQNVVLVVVNRSNSSKNLSLSINGSTVSSLTRYTTSGSKNIRNDGTISNVNGGFSLSLDAQSVTTFVGPLNGSNPTSTPTVTSTPIVPTATRTSTPIVPTATRTSTPSVPTATTVVPTTIVPTATNVQNTPVPGGACRVDYIANSWNTGFTAEVKVTNLGAAITNGWALSWSFANGQQITSGWNATVTQSGAIATARNSADWNAAIPTNGTQSFGFQGTHNGTNEVPTNFTLNGQPCNGTPTTSTPTATIVPQESTVAINVGGTASGSFADDAYFAGGNAFSTSNTIDTSQLSDPVPSQAVLQTERYGEFTYTIPNRVPNSAQTVTLYFQESYWTTPGQRTFDVTINGTTVLTAFDIFAAAGGANRAIARTFTTTANASGQVVIQFARGGGPDNPKVSGISVR